MFGLLCLLLIVAIFPVWLCTLWFDSIVYFLFAVVFGGFACVFCVLERLLGFVVWFGLVG